MKSINGIFYSFLLCGLLWQMSACKPNQPKTYWPPHAGTTTTSPTTGTTPTPITSQLTWTGHLEMTNVKKYHILLREQKRCDQCSITSAGNSSCKRFKALANMELIFEKEELPSAVTLKIIPFRSNTWGTFNVGFCTYTHPNPTAPLLYKGTAKYINNYGGFYIRFHKSADIFGQAGLSYMTLKSEYSLPIDRTTLDITVYYGGSDSDINEMGTAELNHPNAQSTYGHR